MIASLLAVYLNLGERCMAVYLYLVLILQRLDIVPTA